MKSDYLNRKKIYIEIHILGFNMSGWVNMVGQKRKGREGSQEGEKENDYAFKSKYITTFMHYVKLYRCMCKIKLNIKRFSKKFLIIWPKLIYSADFSYFLSANSQLGSEYIPLSVSQKQPKILLFVTSFRNELHLLFIIYVL